MLLKSAVSAGEMRRQRPAAQAHLVAIAHDHVGLHRLVFEAGALQQRVALAAGRDDRPVLGAGVELHVLGRGALQLGQARGVVEVLVGVEQDLDPLGVEAEAADVLDHLWAHRRIAAVDDDQPGLGDDQVGRIVRPADVIEPLADLERRIGLVAGVARRAERGDRKCESGRRDGDRSRNSKALEAH